MSIRLYIGNLPKEVMERQELQDVFQEEGDSVTTKLITDRKTGKCRGFGFVTVKNDEQADQIIEKYNGLQFRETPLKAIYSTNYIRLYTISVESSYFSLSYYHFVIYKYIDPQMLSDHDYPNHSTLHCSLPDDLQIHTDYLQVFLPIYPSHHKS